MIEFERISEEDFEKSNYKLFKLDYSRVYGRIAFGDKSYSIGWRSDLISPEIIEITPNNFSVGIDQKFVVQNHSSDKLMFEMDLKSNFYLSKQFRGKLLIVSECDIYIVNMTTWEIDSQKQLPSLFEDFILNESKIVAKCIEGEEIELIS